MPNGVGVRRLPARSHCCPGSICRTAAAENGGAVASLCEVIHHACTSAAGTWETARAQTRGVEFTGSLRKTPQNTWWPPPETIDQTLQLGGAWSYYALTAWHPPKKIEALPCSARCAEQRGLQLPHTSLPKGLPDATEAPVQFSKVTVLSSAWEKLPPVSRQPPWGTRQTPKNAGRGSNMLLQRPQPNHKISLKT